MILFILIFNIVLGSDEVAKSYYTGIDLQNLNDENLKFAIHKLVSDAHVAIASGAETLTESCSVPNQKCFQHTNLGYKSAREILFGELHLEENNGEYVVEDYYCGDLYTNKHFPLGLGLGVNKIPDPNIINTEHTWPQFRFSNQYPEYIQKSDLHILFPVTQETNSLRGSYHFGEVINAEVKPCPEAALGTSKEGKTVFEPMNNRKGDVARAIFYFSVRYELKIDDDEEAYLRSWHKNDPVDENELFRNSKVFTKQKNRNPFIDYPNLVSKIKNF